MIWRANTLEGEACPKVPQQQPQQQPGANTLEDEACPKEKVRLSPRARKLFVVAGIVAVLTLVGGALWLRHHIGTVTIPNAYALWAAGDVVIAHLEINAGRWPKSWEELRPIVEPHGGVMSYTNEQGAQILEFRPQFSVTEFSNRIRIDWLANPAELALAPATNGPPPIRVVTLANGKMGGHYSGTEPNRRIWEYLQRKHSQTDKNAQ